MTQKIQLPNGDTLEFPDDMADDAIAKAITDNYPQFAPKAAAKPKVLGGLPVDNPIPPAARASTLAGLPAQADDVPANTNAPVSPDGDVTPPADPNAAASQQNQFAPNRVSRAEYEKELRVMKPDAPQGLIDAAMAQYDQQKADQRTKADAARQAGPMKPILSPEKFFEERLNRRLQQNTAEVNDPEDTHDGTGIVPQLPGNQQPYNPHTQTPFDRLREELRYQFAKENGENPDPLPPSNVNPADMDAMMTARPGGPGAIMTNLTTGALSTAAGIGETYGHMLGADDFASDMEKTKAMAAEISRRNGGGTVSGKAANIIGSILPMIAGGAAEGLGKGAGLTVEIASNAGLFGIPAFADTYKAQVAQGRSTAVALEHAVLAASIGTALPTIMPKGGEKMLAALGARDLAGLAGAGAQLGKAAAEGAGFSAVATSSDKLVDQANGIQTDAPYFDTNDMLANAVAFPAMGVGHMGAAAGMGAVDQHVQRAAAESAREDALSLWNNNGLSPSARIDPTRRIEPRWADVAGPGAPTGPAGPAGRREPSIGDITSAGSVDEAIAAANAVVNSASPHATAADIDALEEQAGLTAGSLAAENQAASLAPEASSEPTHDDVMGAMQARAAEAAGKRAAETPPADLPAGPEAAPAAGFTGKESADPGDWNPFPAEMRSLGVPRAQMPQIKAEHRGALVNFLNARGITHEHVEVAPESLRPTQREFSLSKVDKATDFEGGNRSILISSDNYVLDGHHQWMAAALKGEPVQAIRLNAPIKELVKTIHEFPSATVDTSSAGAAPEPAEPGRPLNAYEQGQERIRKQEEAVRQAIEKQAAHRAGQAPQEPGSSIPTAAERAPAAPLPAPKPTAGQRMRERIRRDNPFLAFLATHGLHIDERSDTGGQNGKAGNVIVPGFGGSLYRKKGARLDELAQLAHEAGFLSDDDLNNPADTGGTRKLAEMIERAVHSKEVIEQPGLIEARAPSSDQRLIDEAQRLGVDTEGKTGDQLYDEVRAAHAGEEAKRETSGAETHDEQDAVDHYESQVDPQALADADIPFDLNDPRIAAANNLTDEQIDALFGLQKAAGPRTDRGETEGHAAEPPREGTAPAGEQGEAGQDLLSSYTPGEVVAREDAAATREKATQAERDKLEAQRKKAQDEKEARARADSTVDDFQLGQDAHAQLSGQRGMFDEPVAKQIEKAEEAAPKHTYDPERARPLLLIPCSDAKLEGTHKAIDLYKGVLYDVYRKYKPTENRPDVYILSAKHGIIHADTLLENYEQPMTPERLAELEARPFDLTPFTGKNFNEVYIAGSAQYRQLGQRYVDELRQAGHVGPEAPVGHPPQGAGIGTQRGDFADYLRKVDMRGPANAAELSDQLDAEHAARARPAEKAAPTAEHDDGSDIPHAFYAQVTVPHRVYSDDGKTSAMHDVPADVALESVREDISSLEAMLKCMGA